MFSNLIGSQLLSSYTTEISMIIRYANMVFFAIIILYVFFSKKFENEVEEQIATIKEYEEKNFGMLSANRVHTKWMDQVQPVPFVKPDFVKKL